MSDAPSALHYPRPSSLVERALTPLLRFLYLPGVFQRLYLVPSPASAATRPPRTRPPAPLRSRTG